MAILITIALTTPANATVTAVEAQSDTLRLADLRAAAALSDPRSTQPELLREATELRIKALRLQKRPVLALSGQATIQSDVPDIGVDVPGATISIPVPPHEQFRVQMESEWMLYNGGRINRQTDVERAELAARIADVRVNQYTLREATSRAFFGAILEDARARTLKFAAEDLRVRLRIVQNRAEQGTALRATAAMLEAELIALEQQADEAIGNRKAALAVLGQLTGRTIPDDVHFELPDLQTNVNRVRTLLDVERSFAADTSLRNVVGHPRLDAIESRAHVAELEAGVRRTALRPVISLFGQSGVGQPNPFNFTSTDISEYAIAGVRIRWAIFDWGRTRRETEAMRIQARLIDIEADAFVDAILRDIESELVDIDRLTRALGPDRRAIALLEHALRVAGTQLEEGVLLPDAYTNRLTNLATARLTLERHQIERAMASADLLSALGIFPEPRLPSDRPTDDAYQHTDQKLP